MYFILWIFCFYTKHILRLELICFLFYWNCTLLSKNPTERFGYRNIHIMVHVSARTVDKKINIEYMFVLMCLSNCPCIYIYRKKNLKQNIFLLCLIFNAMKKVIWTSITFSYFVGCYYDSLYHWRILYLCGKKFPMLPSALQI